MSFDASNLIHLGSSGFIFAHLLASRKNFSSACFSQEFSPWQASPRNFSSAGFSYEFLLSRLLPRISPQQASPKNFSSAGFSQEFLPQNMCLQNLKSENPTYNLNSLTCKTQNSQFSFLRAEMFELGVWVPRQTIIRRKRMFGCESVSPW